MLKHMTPVTPSDQNPKPGGKLSAEIIQILAERHQGLPVWVRASKNGYEHFSGLSRAKLYQLAGAGKIKTASLREPCKLRGCRLFHLGSVLEYIAANTEVTSSLKSPREAV